MKSTPPLNLEYLCQNVLVIARLAAREILKIYQSDFAVQNKSDNTPLTTADLAADKVIRQELQQLTPEIPILSEESKTPPYSIRQSWHRYWLVDPLDGTREFIKRNDEFTVNIALIENHRSILGVINAPVLNIDYFAWKDGGAYKKTSQQTVEKIQVRKLNKQQIRIAGSRSHASDKLKAYLQRLGDPELISVGSSLKSCMVAEGSVDLYPRLGLTSEWDTAAAQCIVEEAGGYFKQTDGTTLDYNRKDSLLNPEFMVYGDNEFDWHEFI